MKKNVPLASSRVPRLRVGSVCSGICAPEVAWRDLGWEYIFRSEIEPFPDAVAAHHFPGVPNLGDMTQFRDWPDYAIDLLVGGTPCQSFSLAGLRAGLADARGNLALVFLGIVDRYRPRWLLWENVPGVHSSWSDAAVRVATGACGEMESRARQLAFQAGLDAATIGSCGGFEEADQTNDFDTFLAALAELGYGFATRILDAQYFGLAQRRERVFVVGHIGNAWQRCAAVLFERESLCGDPAPRRPARQGTAPGVANSLGGSSQSGGFRTTDLDNQGAFLPIPIQEIGRRETGTPMNGTGIGQSGDPMFTLKKDAVHGVVGPLPEVAATLLGGQNQTGGTRPPGSTVDNAESLIPEIAWALQRRDEKGPDSNTKEGHLTRSP